MVCESEGYQNRFAAQAEGENTAQGHSINYLSAWASGNKHTSRPEFTGIAQRTLWECGRLNVGRQRKFSNV
jgi:hypothetical protein